MPIDSLCTNKSISIRRSASIETAAQLMNKENVGSLVVVEDNGDGRPLGMVTDRDIALKTFTDGLTPSVSVERIMSKKIVSVPSTAGIAEAVEKMEQNGVRRIVVQDPSNRVCGVVSSDDVLQLVGREMSSIGRLMQKQSSSEIKGEIRPDYSAQDSSRW